MEDQASHPTKTRTAVALSERCIALFNVFYEYQPQWSEDQLARFKIWIDSLGVFRNGHAAIDYRLRDHPDVFNLVAQQLEVLQMNLEKLTFLVSQPVDLRVQEREASGPELFDMDGEDFVFESPTGSEDSFYSPESELELPGYLNSKVLEGLQIVEDTIARLNALSTAIRRSGKHSRASKADQYEAVEYVNGAKVNVTQEFQRYASAIVTREIPGAEEFLKNRLAVSIARRRNRFLYWKRHDKTSKIYVKKIMPSILTKESEVPPQANIPQGEDVDIKKQNVQKDERTIVTGFTATTFDAKNFQKPTESARGSVALTGSTRWKNREDFPRPPGIGIKESHFVCPICFILSPAKEAHGALWIQHVTRDLKPYICVFEGCKSPLTAFDNFEDWIGHMREEMSPEWHCASASHPLAKFKTQGLFETHMREQHRTGFTEAQLPALASRSKRFPSDVFTACPFCSYGQAEEDLAHAWTSKYQSDLQHHISSHLISLAFISLPPLSTGSSLGSDSGGSSRAAVDSRIGHSDTMDSLWFDATSHDLDFTDRSIKPTNEPGWSWDFVWEFLGKRSCSNESSSDPILTRLREMAQQQKVDDTSSQGCALLTARSHSITSLTRRPSLTGWWRCCLCSREVNPHIWGSNCPDCGHVKCGPFPQHGLKVNVSGGSHFEDITPRRVADNTVAGTPPSEVAKGGGPLLFPGEGKDDEAEQRQAVKDRQEMLGLNHPETLTSIDKLAQALFFQGRYKEAADTYRQALAGREKVLGQNHLDTIKSLNNLAQALVYLGHFKAAEELYQQALTAGKNNLASEHPYIFQNIHNLGGAHRRQGRYEEAKVLYQEALVGREKILGAEHPETLQSVNNLGGVLERMGQYAEAEKLYRQALTGRETALGLEHADTLQSAHSLAGALQNLGKYKEAESLYRRALAGREKTLGQNHPNTLKSHNNLAFVLEKQGKYVDAERLYRQVLATREEVLGKEHLDVFQSINNIGSIRLKQSDYEEAEKLYRQALEGRTRVLGPEHPNTLHSMSNLGDALKSLYRLDEAEALYRQALEGRKKLLGEDHPHTQQSALDLAAVTEKIGQRAEGDMA